MNDLSDSDIRAAAIESLVANGRDPNAAAEDFDRWQGDHDYRAWQRGYQEAMIFASNLLMDTADSASRTKPSGS